MCAFGLSNIDYTHENHLRIMQHSLRTYFSGTGILAEGAIALPVTLSGGALFAS